MKEKKKKKKTTFAHRRGPFFTVNPPNRTAWRRAHAQHFFLCYRPPVYSRLFFFFFFPEETEERAPMCSWHEYIGCDFMMAAGDLVSFTRESYQPIDWLCRQDQGVVGLERFRVSQKFFFLTFVSFPLEKKNLYSPLVLLHREEGSLGRFSEGRREISNGTSPTVVEGGGPTRYTSILWVDFQVTCPSALVAGRRYVQRSNKVFLFRSSQCVLAPRRIKDGAQVPVIWTAETTNFVWHIQYVRAWTLMFSGTWSSGIFLWVENKRRAWSVCGSFTRDLEKLRRGGGIVGAYRKTKKRWKCPRFSCWETACKSNKPVCWRRRKANRSRSGRTSCRSRSRTSPSPWLSIENRISLLLFPTRIIAHNQQVFFFILLSIYPAFNRLAELSGGATRMILSL